MVENIRDLYSNPPVVDEAKREAALLEYGELKEKILKDTAIMGALPSH